MPSHLQAGQTAPCPSVPFHVPTRRLRPGPPPAPPALCTAGHATRALRGGAGKPGGWGERRMPNGAHSPAPPRPPRPLHALCRLPDSQLRHRTSTAMRKRGSRRRRQRRMRCRLSALGVKLRWNWKSTAPSLPAAYSGSQAAWNARQHASSTAGGQPPPRRTCACGCACTAGGSSACASAGSADTCGAAGTVGSRLRAQTTRSGWQNTCHGSGTYLARPGSEQSEALDDKRKRWAGGRGPAGCHFGAWDRVR